MSITWVHIGDSEVKTVALSLEITVNLEVLSIDAPSKAEAGDTVQVTTRWRLYGASRAWFDVLLILVDYDTDTQLSGFNSADSRRFAIPADGSSHTTTFSFRMPDKNFRLYVRGWRGKEYHVEEM